MKFYALISARFEVTVVHLLIGRDKAKNIQTKFSAVFALNMQEYTQNLADR